MDANENKQKTIDELSEDSLSLEELEMHLENEVDEQMRDLEFIEAEREVIGSPDALGDSVKNVVWDQFVIQISSIAGEDFIKENNGLKLNLSHDAHFQTTDNFKEGKIATHNTEINYQERYDSWQSNFQKDKDGNVLTHPTRTGEEATLVSGARKRFDKDRPIGSKEKHTAMDHTVPAAEIIRDPAAYAHLTERQQEEFANSEKNLYEMDSSLNASKGDKSTTEWLDNPNSKGQKPDEIFDITEKEDKKMRHKDKEAREEYEKTKQDGEKRSKEAGKKSRRKEAFKIGGKALRAVALQLLADLVKEIINKLVIWLKNKKKSFETFINSVKTAIKSFISKLKEHLINAANTIISTIATAIIGPVVETIKKAWAFLKQGWHSLVEAINFLKDPSNKDMPMSIKVLQVGKIITAGLTAAGALALGEVIEKGLMTVPAFAVEIPLLGSLASIIGIFMGAVVAGIIGAIVINLLDKATAEKRKSLSIEKQVDKGNEILTKQKELKDITIKVTNNKIKESVTSISERHKEAGVVIRKSVTEIIEDSSEDKKLDFDSIDSSLDNLLEEE